MVDVGCGPWSTMAIGVHCRPVRADCPWPAVSSRQAAPDTGDVPRVVHASGERWALRGESD